MAGGRLSFIQISDLHILADDDRPQFGAKTAAILQQAIPLLNALRPDFVVASGDLVSDESEESYRRLQALLSSLEAPIHLMLGNHDDRVAFRQIFRPAETPSRAPVYEAFEQAGVRFLLLDSGLPGKEEGLLDPGQLRWLETELANHPDQPTWLFLHHQPLPIYIRWLDQLGLQNREQFLSVLARHQQLKVVGYGHIHQTRRWRYGHTLFAGVPALAFQFSAVSQEPQITLDTPAFRRFEVVDGDHRSWLHFLDGRVVAEPGLFATPIYVR
ncbi:MAG TPA: phosphodiesterase [Candidatus Methylomirabilis sp.]|nr:phosphodiesterase [Candidatus Methylomirabilis sp.]